MGINLGVLIVDDQLAVREGVSRLIACAGFPLRAIGTAATCIEAMSVAALLNPEVVILDADLDGEDGLALIPQLSRTAGVLVLTSHGDSATRTRATILGALAFIEKHQPAADLLGCIAEILQFRSQGDKAPALPGARSHPSVTDGSDVSARIQL